MTDVQDVETGARARTRRAIVEAAVTQLARDPGVALGQVADAAGVGRTTLHRYFPERSDLLEAVGAETVARLGEAHERARLDQGTAREALRRLCPEYLLLGDHLTLLFTEVVPDAPADGCADDDPMVALVERGRDDGSLDLELSPSWVIGTIWAQLYLAWETLREGHESRHDVVQQLMRTVDKALAP
ncbi:TetR/AcrR family transcriptional regulator [Krasilnikoviella flava]|uniref:Transcriptional regulator, TetR family n=1 Tax=Krasilnikoviella flava TaxID=526729 RepID=A0A1T5JYX1_9MICO|nr:TetR/AcrR family transcriptional regulator [Krasilnikoviella flava]SKC56601.1 transcriptional regulator, TetR family [Krasilnikoviella flava]